MAQPGMELKVPGLKSWPELDSLTFDKHIFAVALSPCLFSNLMRLFAEQICIATALFKMIELLMGWFFIAMM
jgi:hypothetical protein